MIYNCSRCNYETNDFSNIERHYLTKNILIKV